MIAAARTIPLPPFYMLLLGMLLGCASQPRQHGAPLTCFDRESAAQTALVDSHVHFRPFGGRTLAFVDMVKYLERSGVHYATVYGIGQMLPLDSGCVYYLDCPGVPVTPTLKNDFVNASEFVRTGPHKVHLTLSMTFPDLSDPRSVLAGMRVLDREFPGVFGWMGEVNLVKQALFDNHHEVVPIHAIADWAPFMQVLLARGMPLSIHADLGNNDDPTKYQDWMKEVLRLYPHNKIVWMHLGLSRELTRIDPKTHITVMREWLDAYPNLMMDLSWRVVDDAIFASKAMREAYLPFLHAYSTRFLPGSDFVATGESTRAHYVSELRATSRIFRHLDDAAFRNIALGENYFRLLGLDREAPELCSK